MVPRLEGFSNLDPGFATKCSLDAAGVRKDLVPCLPPGVLTWVRIPDPVSGKAGHLAVHMLVKKDDDISSTFFSVIPTISGFNAKSITFTFFLLGICLQVYRCWQVAFRMFYPAKTLFYCRNCTKKEGVLLTGARSSLWPSVTVVCLQVFVYFWMSFVFK